MTPKTFLTNGMPYIQIETDNCMKSSLLTVGRSLAREHYVAACGLSRQLKSQTVPYRRTALIARQEMQLVNKEIKVSPV